MKKVKSNIFYLYSIVFFLFIFVALLPSEIKTGTLFGVGLFTDGIKQHLVFMQDYVRSISEALKGQPLSIYRYDLGLGNDFFLHYTYYSLFDPLTIIAYIIPIKYIEFSYYFLIILRLYFSGIAIIFLARKFNIRNNSALLGTAVFYSLNITTLYSAFRHPMFINGPLLLPLIILGAEKVLRRESPFLLIIASFLSLITQFYLYIYASFGFVLFVLIRLFPLIKEKSYKKFFKELLIVSLFFALGACLGGFVLLPQLMATLSGGRVTSGGFVFYSFMDYLSYLGSFFIPVIGTRYTPTIGNFIILFVILVYLFTYKKSWEKYYLLFLIVMVFIPFFGYAINVFSYINNRWTYLLLLPTALILGKVIQNPDDITERAYINTTRTMLILVCLTVGVGVLALLDSLNNLLIVILGAIIFICFEFYAIRMISNLQYGLKFKFVIKPRLLTRLTLISSFVVLLGVALAYTFFLSASEGLNAYDDKDALSVLGEEEGFYRVDQNTYILNSDYLSNDNIVYGYPSTYAYNTMVSGSTIDMIEFFNVVNLNNTVGYNGFNDRWALNAVSQVKYLVVRDSDRIKIPYGYSLWKTIKLAKFDSDRFNEASKTGYIEYVDGKPVYEDAGIYINDHFLNFGFVYDRYLTSEDLENISGIGRENVLLEAVILEDAISLPKYQANDLPALPLPDLITENMQIEDGKIIVSEDQGSMSFTIPNVQDAEVYIAINGLENVDRYQGFQVFYEANGTLHLERNYGYGTNFYIANPNHLVNLGYFDQETVTVKISFKKGEYRYDNIYYYLNPMGEVVQKVERLNQRTLQNLNFNTNGFSGDIELDEVGFLYI
ncbi:MAG: YfhO family protein, partial [Acholeplasmataceae bacterium]|nr:YfhO family protein [Acholeplasmataceae bacterium]